MGFFQRLRSLFSPAQATTGHASPEGGVAYPKLPPRGFASLAPHEYIAERFNDTIAWYDGKAVTAKRKYQWMRATSVIFSALVPFLANIRISGGQTYSIPLLGGVSFDFTSDGIDLAAQGVTTVISLTVVILVALEGVYHYREQWVNYRSTEQFMRREYYLFTTREGPYVRKTEREAYLLFVERIEDAISGENASTLQILTRVAEAPRKNSPTASGAPPPRDPDAGQGDRPLPGGD